MTEPLKPLKVVSVSDQVAAGIRSAILAGQFKEGDVLNLHELAEAFGVSNTPVRAAMQMLANDGLVMLRPNKGAVVIGMSVKRIRDYYQVRTMLESGAAALACKAEDMSVLTQNFSEAQACVDAQQWEGYARCNRHFHQAIWELGGNDRLCDLLSNLWNTSSRPKNSSEKEYVLYSHEEHREIYEAIMSREETKASACMQRHLERALRDVLTHSDEGGSSLR